MGWRGGAGLEGRNMVVPVLGVRGWVIGAVGEGAEWAGAGWRLLPL